MDFRTYAAVNKMSDRENCLAFLILSVVSEIAEKTRSLQRQSVVERISILSLIMASMLLKISLVGSIILFVAVILSMIVLQMVRGNTYHGNMKDLAKVVKAYDNLKSE